MPVVTCYLDIVVIVTTGAFNLIPGVGDHFWRQHFGAFTEKGIVSGYEDLLRATRFVVNLQLKIRSFLSPIAKWLVQEVVHPHLRT